MWDRLVAKSRRYANAHDVLTLSGEPQLKNASWIDNYHTVDTPETEAAFKELIQAAHIYHAHDLFAVSARFQLH